MNVLFIMSDEHRRDAMGIAGHPSVLTPNLDRLASDGVLFSNAYCNSPLCVPSRASLAAGRYVHEIQAYDNAAPYAGDPESWGHHLSRHNVSVTTVGKLHFEPNTDDGFPDKRQTYPTKLDPYAYYRDPVIPRPHGRDRITEAGPGEWHVDRTTRETQEAVRFLKEEAPSKRTPWVLWVSYLVPHFPLKAPPSFYKLYSEKLVDLPFDYPARDRHPILEELRLHFGGQNVDEETLRKTRAAYYGLVSYLDAQIGQLLRALHDSGLEHDTVVIYTSDHGEMLGDHELWWKCSMYEGSVGIPLIIRDPLGRFKGTSYQGLVSLLDVGATLIDAVGLDGLQTRRGSSLLTVTRSDTSEFRGTPYVFSEYHGHGTSRGNFMIREEDWKYVYYVDHPSQLFNLHDDPLELTNLAQNVDYRDVLAQMDTTLRKIVDPEREHQRAFYHQQQRHQRLGATELFE